MGSSWEKAHPRYAPKIERPVPAWDPQDYSQASEASGVDFRPSFRTSSFDGQEPSPPIALTLFVSCLLAFALTLGARLFGPYVFTSWGMPVLVGGSLFYAGWTYVSTGDASAALFALFLLPLVIAASAFAVGATDSTPVRFLSMLVALLVAAVLVDSIGGYALTWRLKDLAVSDQHHEKWLSWWTHRFDTPRLRAEASALSGEADALRSAGRKLEALSRRIDAAYLVELASYRQALLVLPLAAALSLLPGSVFTLSVVPLAVSVLWVGRAPLPASVRLMSFALRQGVRTWFYFGVRGGDSADVWRPPSGDPRYRILLFTLALVMLSAALLPPTPYAEKVVAAATTQRELWNFIFRIVAELLLPLLVLLATLFAALGRFLAQVEYAPFSKEGLP